MSHEPSFRRSSQALTAALIVISCLIIVPGIRFLSSRLPMTQARRDAVETARVHDHLQVEFSEFYPNAVKTRKTNGNGRTSTTIQRASSVSHEQSVAVADRSRADSKSVSVSHYAPSTPGSPSVTVPVTVNVNNGELVSELMRIHHRISDAQDTQNLLEQAAPTNSSVSAPPAIPRVFQYEVHGVALTTVESRSDSSQIPNETTVSEKELEVPASATAAPVKEATGAHPIARQVEKMRRTPRKQTAQLLRHKEQKPIPSRFDVSPASDFDPMTDSTESTKVETTEVDTSSDESFAPFEALESPEITPRATPEKMRAESIESSDRDSFPAESIQLEPGRQRSIRTERVPGEAELLEFDRPETNHKEISQPVLKPVSPAVSHHESLPKTSTPPEFLPIVLLPAELLPPESLPEFAMPEATTPPTDMEPATAEVTVEAQWNELDWDREPTALPSEIKQQSSSQDEVDFLIARPPEPIPSIPTLKREQTASSVEAANFSSAAPSTRVPPIPVPQQIQQASLIEVAEAVVVAPSTPVPPVPVLESIPQSSFGEVTNPLAAVPNSPVPPVPELDAIQEFETEAPDDVIVAQPGSPVPPIPDLASIRQTSGLQQDDLVFVQSDSQFPAVPVPDLNFQQSSNNTETVFEPQFQIPSQHDAVVSDISNEQGSINEEPIIAMIPPVPDPPTTAEILPQDVGHQITSNSFEFDASADAWSTSQSSSAAVRHASRFFGQNMAPQNPAPESEVRQNPWNSISQRLAKVVNGESRLHKVPGQDLHRSQHQYGKQAHATPEKRRPSVQSPAGPSMRTAIVNNVQAFNQRMACTLETIERTQVQAPEWLVRLPDSDPFEPVRQSPTLHRVTSAVRFATKPKALR